jgi:hypothetical protein
MKPLWSTKSDREKFEISEFISAYARIPGHRSLKVDSKQENPDYFLKDVNTGEICGVELTSVYLDDHSVPDEHMKLSDGWEEIPYNPMLIEQHNLRLIDAIKTKI